MGTAAPRHSHAFLRVAIRPLRHSVGVQQQLRHGQPDVHITLPSQNPAAVSRQQPSQLPAEPSQATSGIDSSALSRCVSSWQLQLPRVSLYTGP